MLFFYVPQYAEAKAQSTFRTLGLENVSLGKPDIFFKSMRYKDLALDNENFSTLKTLKIHYNPLKLITKGEIESIVIEGLSLTGELKNNKTISIAGWSETKIRNLQRNFNLRKIDIKEANLALLTENFGGLNIEYNGELRRKNKNIEFKGRVHTNQSKVSFTAGLSGTINPQSQINAIAEIEKGKFHSENIKVTRLSGGVKLSYQNGHSAHILSNFRAGGLSVAGFGWQSVSGSLETDLISHKLFLGAEGVGTPNLELSLSMDTKKTPAIVGNVHAAHIDDLLSYLDLQNIRLEKEDVKKKYNDAENIDIEFTLDQGTQTLEVSVGEEQPQAVTINSLKDDLGKLVEKLL